MTLQKSVVLLHYGCRASGPPMLLFLPRLFRRLLPMRLGSATFGRLLTAALGTRTSTKSDPGHHPGKLEDPLIFLCLRFLARPGAEARTHAGRCNSTAARDRALQRRIWHLTLRSSDCFAGSLMRRPHWSSEPTAANFGEADLATMTAPIGSKAFPISRAPSTGQ